MSKEAMRLALEALEVLGWQPTEEAMDYRDNAISALREALAEQPAQKALDKMADNERELGIQMEPEKSRAWFTVDELNAWADKKLKENPQWAEQPAQQEPERVKFERHWRETRGEKKASRELPRHPLQPQTYIQDSANRHWVTWQAAVRSVAQPAQRTWVGLTDEEIEARAINFYNPEMYKRAVLWAQERLKERNQ